MQGIDNLPKGGGSSTLSGLADVNFSSLTQGDLLIYDGAEWINHSFTEGHDILNESGSAVTARDNLQFTDGLKVTDDSGNNKTKVGVDTAFTEASTRANIDSGDTFSTILGKIKKWFTDIPNLFVSKTGDTMTGRLTLTPSSTGTVIESYRNHTGTSSKATDILLGNNIANGTAGSCYGRVTLYGKGTNYTVIDAPNSTANRTIDFPDKSGTVALTSDIPDVSGKVNKSGDTMTGTLKIDGGNGIQLMNGAVSTILYQQSTAGAVVNAIEMPNGTGTLALRSDIPSKVSQLTNDSGFITESGTAARISAIRLNSKNLNNIANQNTLRADECNSNCSNLPSAYWYYVFTIQGSDTGYAGQLAMQMTGGNAVYYRAKDGGTWSSWRSL